MSALTPTIQTTRGKIDTDPVTINPNAYMGINSIQRMLNLRVLDLLQDSFMGEPKLQQVLDLGCGTGDFTRNHLLPRCPPLERMIAVDVSEDMVEYAKKNYAHPKICYDVLDISGNGVTDFIGRYGQFDRVYSFFCLHWSSDQKTAIKNIAELLKPGGGCLLLFGASGGVLQLSKELAAMEHWQKYQKKVENSIPASTGLADREALLSYIRDLLQNTSLISTTCEVLEVTPKSSSTEAANRVFMAMNRLSTLVTEEEKPILLKDVGEFVAKRWTEKEAGKLSHSSTMFLVRAHKPERATGGTDSALRCSYAQY